MIIQELDRCKFLPDPADEGEHQGYFREVYDDRRWREVYVPCTFETCLSALDTYEGTGWFRFAEDVPAEWQGQRVALRFEGVNYHARVWVNGQEAGANADGFLPFEFEVGDQLRFGTRNVIAVRVDNYRRQGEVPGMQRGWRTFGGILREVRWVVTDPLYLRHLTVVAEPTGQGGHLSVRARVANGRARGGHASIRVRVTGSEGQVLAALSSPAEEISGMQECICVADGPVPGAQPWSPSAPNLYAVAISLLLDGQEIEAQCLRVGFRTVEARAGELLLNGESIYLTGFNRHEDSPRRDMAPDLEIVRQDLLDIKAAGANFVRLCHYPHHPGELDLCDELGLLAMGEIPLYWWDGDQEGEQNRQSKLAAAKRQITTMIRRDINHPSLIFWSVSNENEESRPEVIEGNRELVCLAQELDPTRLAVHVSSWWQKHPHFDPDDVICVNAYPSLNARGYGGQPDYDLANSTRFWRESLETLHARYPGKPILVTEFGYAAFKDVYEGAFGEELQAQAIEAEFAGMDAPYVCGATIWCWADHPWPQATFPFCRHMGISPYGVVSRDRRKLQAYRTVRRIYTQKHGLYKVPAPAVLQPGQAGYSLDMIRPHLRDIPQVPIPEGFSIRPMRIDEGGTWTDVERDAERYFPITDDVFMREFGYDLPAIERRCYLIVDSRGVSVGTISAWYNNNFQGQDYGLIHWVAVRPAYQGKGLGKAGLSFALNQLARWHERAALNTQSKRLPALNLYLDFGFVPNFTSPELIKVWEDIQAQIHHPALERALASVR